MVHDCCDCLGAHQKVVFMNKEIVVAMAHEASPDMTWYAAIENPDQASPDELAFLMRFAELVEQYTHTNNKARWYQEGVEAEREACAKLAEEPYEFTSEEAHRIAASIRARANDTI
jgi:hypothetical protein